MLNEYIIKNTETYRGRTMIEQIRRCQKCGLCFNQKPLLDTEKRMSGFWVGLSAKKNGI